MKLAIWTPRVAAYICSSCALPSGGWVGRDDGGREVEAADVWQVLAVISAATPKPYNQTLNPLALRCGTQTLNHNPLQDPTRSREI